MNKRCKKCGQMMKTKGKHTCPTSAWNKGTKGVMKAWNKGLPAPWAKNLPQGYKKGDKSRLGAKATPETLDKLKISHTGKTGERSSNWQGGKSYSWKVKNAPTPRPKICEACGSNGTICYDHDHNTGEFRGWICMQCNFALGQVHDDIKILLDLVSYLKKHENKYKTK